MTGQGEQGRRDQRTLRCLRDCDYHSRVLVPLWRSSIPVNSILASYPEREIADKPAAILPKFSCENGPIENGIDENHRLAFSESALVCSFTHIQQDGDLREASEQ